MSDFLFNVLLFFGYLLGVLISLVMIAWYNASRVWKQDRESPMLAMLSWLFIAVVLMCVMVGVISMPFEWFYKKLKKFFDGYYNCKD